MKKYINLRTFMSLLYLLTFIILAVLMVSFPQTLSAEPTMLGGVLCGAFSKTIGMATFLLIDAVRSTKAR